MAGAKAGFRHRLFRAVHAEAVKRKMDHDALHDMCVRDFKVHSMSELSDAQLEGIYRQWTGKTLKRRAKLPSAGWKTEPAAIASGAEIEDLAREFAKRGMGLEAQKNLTRRQLKGRDQIRSRRDWTRVIQAVRAMNAREGL